MFRDWNTLTATNAVLIFDRIFRQALEETLPKRNITSTEQIAFAKGYTEGLPVDIVKCDYRDLPEVRESGSFDRILICGMIEHVGYRNYRRIMRIVHDMLAPGGLFLLHTIGNSVNTTIADPWIVKYIFRNSMLPSMQQLAGAVKGLFTVHDWENYGHYYAPTLAAWQSNFERNWDEIAALDTVRPFDGRFRRMFNYYFLSCKAAFEVESIYLWHLVMSRKGEGRDVYPRVNLLA